MLAIPLNEQSDALEKVGYRSVTHLSTDSSNNTSDFSFQLVNHFRTVFVNPVLDKTPKKKVQWTHIGGMGSPRVVSASRNESSAKRFSQHVQRCNCCMRCCLIRLKPLVINLASSPLQTRNEFLQHGTIVQFVHCHCLPVLVFRKTRSNDATAAKRTPSCDLWAVKGPLAHHIRSLISPVDV